MTRFSPTASTDRNPTGKRPRWLGDDACRSLLFLEVNGDTAGVGQRVPFGGLPLDPREQALILDWMAGGAPASVTRGIFRSGFDRR